MSPPRFYNPFTALLTPQSYKGLGMSQFTSAQEAKSNQARVSPQPNRDEGAGTPARSTMTPVRVLIYNNSLASHLTRDEGGQAANSGRWHGPREWPEPRESIAPASFCFTNRDLPFPTRQGKGNAGSSDLWQFPRKWIEHAFFCFTKHDPPCPTGRQG
ncbi:hypothetical protein DFP72DRAFT_38928 [Ephemerocybe angulata]|uniref:Uncharacterized protein n=1 Tax=Ephemerocybe angulata TaxID=980116 RepID=A0A8H6I9G2_9AGAR|nr:hypothetical protein DFP72DRAFT_38928 [Tulosesus angulatus]